MIPEVTTPAPNVSAARAALVRKLLWGLLGLLVVATFLSVVISGRDALTIESLAINVLIAVALAAGLLLLNKKRLRSVIWLEAGVLMLTAVQGLRFGIDGNEARLLIFVAPITMVGLLVGRRALYLTAALSLAVVLAVYALELAESPLIMTETDPAGPIGGVVIFGIIAGLLVLFLDRFALSLEDALIRSTLREEELRREMERRKGLETRLQLATEAAQIGLWRWDPSTNAIDWTPKMKELFGVAADEEVTIDKFFDRVHPEDREAMRAGAENEDEGSADRPYRVVLPDGKVRWLIGRGRLLERPDGGTQMLGAAYDVTALLEAESERAELFGKEQAARREAEQVGKRLAFLADSSHILAGSLDYRETLRRVAALAVPRLADWCAIDTLNADDELERLVVAHTDPEKVRFAHDLQRLYPPDRDAPTGAYGVLRSGEPVFLPEVDEEVLKAFAIDEQHLEILRGVGFTSVIIAPLISRRKPLGVLILVHAESGRSYSEDDLSLAMQLAERAAASVDNSRLYGEAKSLNAELEERVEARTEELRAANTELESFTYSASHDLRAPLRGINGFSQALLDDYGDQLDEIAREYLGRIHAGATRMGELIDDLLELSRISKTAVNLEAIDLGVIAGQVLADLRSLDPARPVEAVIEPELEACGDGGLIRIALENLLGNAWKFTEGRDPARITLGRDEGRDAFFVRDNGAGFSMAYASKLFVPFQRLHPAESYSGTGIGLATTKRIIERHGGRLWGEGKVDAGASFYFTLPAATGGEAQPEAG